MQGVGSAGNRSGINYPGFYPEYLVNPEEVYTTGCPTRPGVDTHQTGS